MRRWTLATAASALVAAALWHLPAIAQHAAKPEAPASAATTLASGTPTARPPAQSAAPALITFDEYRDYRMQNIGQRQESLAERLAAPNLTASDKADLERRKAYYDRLATMPAEERDAMFRTRFDQIDTDHDGTIDARERAAWREKQRDHYRQMAAERLPAAAAQH